MIVAIVIYCIWFVSVASAVGSEGLLGETGTALVSLANKIGPGIYILGVVFAVLGLGMSSVHFGLGIFNLSKEIFDPKSSSIPSDWLTQRASMIAAVLPMFAVFCYVQWTFYTGTSSFTAPLELLGALLTPVLAGVFPVLLLIASRRRASEVTEAAVSSIMSKSWVLGGIVILFVSGLLLHALVLWVNPIAQAAALLVSIAMLILTVDTVRPKSLFPVLVNRYSLTSE